MCKMLSKGANKNKESKAMHLFIRTSNSKCDVFAGSHMESMMSVQYNWFSLHV